MDVIRKEFKANLKKHRKDKNKNDNDFYKRFKFQKKYTANLSPDASTTVKRRHLSSAPAHAQQCFQLSILPEALQGEACELTAEWAKKYEIASR